MEDAGENFASLVEGAFKLENVAINTSQVPELENEAVKVSRTSKLEKVVDILWVVVVLIGNLK